MPHTCPNCRIGTLRHDRATYAAWHGEQFVVVPSAPVTLCDVCGERLYDMRALEQVLLLIGPRSLESDADGTVDVQRGAEALPSSATSRNRRRV